MLHCHARIFSAILPLLLFISPVLAETDDEIIARVDSTAKWPTQPTLTKIAEFPNTIKAAHGGGLTPDGKYLLVGGYSKLGVWNLETGQQIAHVYPIRPIPPQQVAISNDGKWAVFGHASEVALIDVETEKIVRIFHDLKTRITSIHFSPDGKQLFVCEQDGNIMIVDLEKPDANPEIVPKPAEGIEGCAYATLPDGKKLFLYNRENSRRMRVTRVDGVERFLAEPGNSVCRIVPGIDRFLVPEYDRIVGIHVREDGAVNFATKKTPDYLRGAQYTSDQKSFWLIGGYSLSFRDTLTVNRGLTAKLPREAAGRDVVTLVAPDKRMVVAFDKETIRVWKVEGKLFDASQDSLLLLSDLIAQERFELLNQLGNRWADRHQHFELGYGDSPYSHLCGYVQEAAKPGGTLSEKIDFFENYLKDHPENTLMRIALFNIYNNRAFELRGDGFANTVTEEGWKGFYENMQKAWATLQPVLIQEKFPPEAFMCTVLIFRNLQQDKAIVEKVIDRALDECPQYSRIFQQEAFARLPRWGGEVQDAEKLAARVAETIGGDEGDMAYAQIANHLLNAVRRDELFGPYGFDEERVMKGYLHWNKVSPDSEVANLALAFAKRTEDGDAALEIYKRFEERGDIPSYKYWGEQYRSFHEVPNWAVLHGKPQENPFSLPSSDE